MIKQTDQIIVDVKPKLPTCFVLSRTFSRSGQMNKLEGHILSGTQDGQIKIDVHKICIEIQIGAKRPSCNAY